MFNGYASHSQRLYVINPGFRRVAPRRGTLEHLGGTRKAIETLAGGPERARRPLTEILQGLGYAVDRIFCRHAGQRANGRYPWVYCPQRPGHCHLLQRNYWNCGVAHGPGCEPDPVPTTSWPREAHEQLPARSPSAI